MPAIAVSTVQFKQTARRRQAFGPRPATYGPGPWITGLADFNQTKIGTAAAVRQQLGVATAHDRQAATQVPNRRDRQHRAPAARFGVRLMLPSHPSPSPRIPLLRTKSAISQECQNCFIWVILGIRPYQPPASPSAGRSRLSAAIVSSATARSNPTSSGALTRRGAARAERVGGWGTGWPASGASHFGVGIVLMPDDQARQVTARQVIARTWATVLETRCQLASHVHRHIPSPRPS
jgi:hypothetical protein